MLTILAGVATWEREIMLERQREGIAKAKAEGKYKGRNPTVGLQVDLIRKMRAEGLGPATIARRLGVAHSSVYRMLETPMPSGAFAPLSRGPSHACANDVQPDAQSRPISNARSMRPPGATPC
jgi:hypothetical protein